MTTAILLLLWSLGLAVVSAVAIRRSRERRRQGPTAWATLAPPRLLLIRPCHGAEPLLWRTLNSSASLRRQPPPAVLHVLGSEDDLARPAAAASAAFSSQQGVPARVVITGAVSPNHKADQIARAVRTVAEPWDILIVADSDVLLERERIEALLAPLADPRVGAVWAPPAEQAPSATLGDRASGAVLGASLHSFALLAGLDLDGVVGKLLAVRRTALAAVGGFAALTTVLGEDVELGRRLRAEGWHVAVAARPARSLASGRGLGAVVDRYARWVQVVRGQRPWLLPSYPLLFFATPVVVGAGLVLSAAGLKAGSPGALGAGLAAVGVTFCARLAVALEARRATGAARALRSPWRLVSDAWLADLTLAAAFARASVSRRLVWRGRRLRLSLGGRLEEVA